ncbi:DUF1292 domain-containing protein [Pontibacillus litoralis]|uniref:UPF0473 protein N784_01115 n=1 Tax=Pontibacillus litoralis JSM 072002 TaxID=1385512 RepID=A0A0A5G760_9BACI|nr:DUF1292 domain-containing protein [Pontibacillus litoralis]KGX88966.1 hypothetical protein N784_01115 [Pontibacillus litoralis JSM 072002]
MANEEKERIIIPDENGEEHLFEVVFEFDVDQTGHSYIAVVPVEQKESEQAELYAFRFEDSGDDEELALYQIESDEEWDMVEEVLGALIEEQQ